MKGTDSGDLTNRAFMEEVELGLPCPCLVYAKGMEKGRGWGYDSVSLAGQGVP